MTPIGEAARHRLIAVWRHRRFIETRPPLRPSFSACLATRPAMSSKLAAAPASTSLHSQQHFPISPGGHRIRIRNIVPVSRLGEHQALWRTSGHRPTSTQPPLDRQLGRDGQPLANDIAAILAINLLHIAPWSAAEGLLGCRQTLLGQGWRADHLRPVRAQRRPHRPRATPPSMPIFAGRTPNGACATSLTLKCSRR